MTTRICPICGEERKAPRAAICNVCKFSDKKTHTERTALANEYRQKREVPIGNCECGEPLDGEPAHKGCRRCQTLDASFLWRYD